MDGRAHRALVGLGHRVVGVVGRRLGDRLLACLEGVAGSVEHHAQVCAQLLGELRLLRDGHDGSVVQDLVCREADFGLEGEDVLLRHHLHRVALGGVAHADDHGLRLGAEPEVSSVEHEAVGGLVRPPAVGQLADRGQLRRLDRVVRLADGRLQRREVDAGGFQLLAQPEAQPRALLEELRCTGVDLVGPRHVALLDVHRGVSVVAEHLHHCMALGGRFDGDDDRREVVSLAPAEAEAYDDPVEVDLAAGGGQDLGDVVELGHLTVHLAQPLERVQLLLDFVLLGLHAVLFPGLDGLGLREQRAEDQLVVQRFLLADAAVSEGLLQKPHGHVVPGPRRLDRRGRLCVLEAQHGATLQVLEREHRVADVVFAGDAGEDLLHGGHQVATVQLFAGAVAGGRTAGVAAFGAREASATGDDVVVIVAAVAGPGALLVAHGNLSSRRCGRKS